MLRPARNAIQMTFRTPGHIDHGLEKMQVKRPSQKLNLLKTSVFFDNRRAEGNLLRLRLNDVLILSGFLTTNGHNMFQKCR